MSYTGVTAQRSQRYPMMGTGCACTGMGAFEMPRWPTLLAVLGGAAVVGFGLRAALRKNRRRRSRR